MVARILPFLLLAVVAGRWIERGGSATGGGISDSDSAASPSLAFSTSGNPVVAWHGPNGGGAKCIYFRRLNGSATAWEELGGSGSGGGISNPSVLDSESPSVVVDSGGDAIVAWSQGAAGGPEIYLKRWDVPTLSWVEIGGSATGGGISNTAAGSWGASLAMNPSGNSVVAWHDFTPGDSEIYLRQWNPGTSSWDELGGSGSGGGVSDNAGASESCSLAVDSAGDPWIAWADDTSGTFQVYLRKWNPGTSSWIELGGSASGGGISNSVTDAGGCSLALDGADTPVVVYQVFTGAVIDIYLKKWDSVLASWVEVDGSASGGGVSSTGGNSTDPSLAITTGGNYVVSWLEETSGVFDVYLKRWSVSRSRWEALGTSASSGGINRTSENCVSPALAVNSAGTPLVAWRQTLSGTTEIYARQFRASSGSPVSSGGGGSGCGLLGFEALLLLALIPGFRRMGRIITSGPPE